MIRSTSAGVSSNSQSVNSEVKTSGGTSRAATGSGFVPCLSETVTRRAPAPTLRRRTVSLCSPVSGSPISASFTSNVSPPGVPWLVTNDESPGWGSLTWLYTGMGDHEPVVTSSIGCARWDMPRTPAPVGSSLTCQRVPDGPLAHKQIAANFTRETSTTGTHRRTDFE